MMHQNKPGFTLIELLVYVAIAAVILTGVVAFFWDVLLVQSKTAVQQETEYAVQYVHDRITAELLDAASVLQLSASDICLESRTTAFNPVHVYTDSGKLMMGWGGGGTNCNSVANTAALTSDQITVTKLEFTDVSGGAEEFISFSVDLEYTNTSGRSEWEDSVSVTGGVKLR